MRWFACLVVAAAVVVSGCSATPARVRTAGTPPPPTMVAVVSPPAAVTPTTASPSPAPPPSASGPQCSGAICVLPTAPGTVVRRRAGSWSALPAAEATGPVDVVSVAALANGTVLASAIDGVWASSDGGSSWRRTMPITAQPSYEQQDVWRWLYPAGSGVVLDIGSRLAFTSNGTDWRSVTPGITDAYSPDGRHYLSSPVVFDGTGLDADGLTYSTITHSGSPTSPMEHTSDGGRHWLRVANELVSLDPAFVPGSRTVFASPFSWKQSGDSCAPLQRSDDGGATWRVQPIPCLHQLLGTITFADARHGSVFTGGADLLVTADGGATWTRRTRTATRGPDQGPAQEVSFVNSTLGFALSSGQFNSSCNSWPIEVCLGKLLRTRDGGRSWTDTGRVAGPISTAGNTVIVGGGLQSELAAGVAVSRDGGATWRPFKAAADVRLRQLSRVGGQLVAVTTAGGATSADDGRRWTAVPQPSEARTADPVYARTGSTVLSIDDQGRLERSTDDGATWHPAPGPLGEGRRVLARALAFNSTDPTKAVALAQDNTTNGFDVLLSSDTGATWVAVASLRTLNQGPVGYDGNTIAFADQGVDVSTDNGRHWSERPLGAPMSAAAVAGAAIWAVGGNGGTSGEPWRGVTTALSTDGGVTWTTHAVAGLPTDGYNAVVDIVALSATEALLTTDGSTLWRTTDSGISWRQERPAVLPD